LPVAFIETKLGTHESDDWNRKCVIAFMQNPSDRDLDQEVKRWLESLLQLEPGSIADPRFYESMSVERKRITYALQTIFIKNVRQHLTLRKWTTATLASKTGIPLDEIGDDENVVFKSFFMRHLVTVSNAFKVEPWQLLMERGTEVQRESATAFAELPDYVRWVISYIYSAVREEVDGHSTDAAQTVTGLLPVLVGVLKYAQQEAVRNPKLVDTARTLLTAFAPEMLAYEKFVSMPNTDDQSATKLAP